MVEPNTANVRMQMVIITLKSHLVREENKYGMRLLEFKDKRLMEVNKHQRSLP